MIELQTEVCLAVVESFLEKKEEERNEKHNTLVKEAMGILKGKQAQFSEKDHLLFKRAMEAGL